MLEPSQQGAVMSDTTRTANPHTPGPWEIVPVGALDFRKPGEYGVEDYAIRSANGICPGIVWAYMAEGLANARLIAESPAMYALLERVADGHEITMAEAAEIVRRVRG